MKMKSTVAKRCVICHKIFHPDKRTVHRQKVCDDLKCKVKYKQITNKQWRNQQENADYFKGRYGYLISWLQQHPGYLNNYRHRKKRNQNQKTSDIQDELTQYKNNVLTNYTVTILNDIQVELNTNINSKINQLLKSVAMPDELIYKLN